MIYYSYGYFEQDSRTPSKAEPNRYLEEFDRLTERFEAININDSLDGLAKEWQRQEQRIEDLSTIIFYLLVFLFPQHKNVFASLLEKDALDVEGILKRFENAPSSIG